MPIHFEKNDEHIVKITIDRPEARNALDLTHFRDLAAAWRRFKDDDDAWVAIVTGVERNFMVGADLKTYIPQITELQKKIADGEVDEIDGCKLSDGTTAVLRNVKLYKPVIAAIKASGWLRAGHRRWPNAWLFSPPSPSRPAAWATRVASLR